MPTSRIPRTGTRPAIRAAVARHFSSIRAAERVGYLREAPVCTNKWLRFGQQVIVTNVDSYRRYCWSEFPENTEKFLILFHGKQQSVGMFGTFDLVIPRRKCRLVGGFVRLIVLLQLFGFPDGSWGKLATAEHAILEQIDASLHVLQDGSCRQDMNRTIQAVTNRDAWAMASELQADL
ncbi:pyridoxal-dependent decarboxylase [Anopheles sinensis]|uniref:Pyridoxal-dependent decarboxylase n=1 Tax=Anopheles sinensis TaxID=74873 RepID=A0A084VEP2_ANOSI|nr:pyridoxal-dependent decarboxylase [Anopheles sinensis]